MPFHARPLNSSCVVAMDRMRPSRAATNWSIVRLVSSVQAATALTVASTFFTRWSSSAISTRWWSSVRLRSVTVKGPDVLLSAGAGQTIGMVFHELITNAAKYGALSTRNGRLSVRWDWPRNGKVADRLVMEWREIGGPAVKAPGRAGHGMEVIRDLVPYELEGNVDLAFASEGVRCSTFLSPGLPTMIG
jgi:two-component sensor histidine kinase